MIPFARHITGGCLLLLLTLHLSPVPAAGPTTGPVFARADQPRQWQFPRDHGSHPDFQTEWWYFTGNLESASGGKFGYQFTIFRRALVPGTIQRESRWAVRDLYLAHGALTDVPGEKYYHVQKMLRPTAGMAGSSTSTLEAWVDPFRVAPSSSGWNLQGRGEGFSYNLHVTSSKPIVFHGPGGVDIKSSATLGASYYYSMTRMETSGTIQVNGATVPVTGLSWFDHEFGSSQMAPDQQGWDWFSLQLSDGADLMLYNLRLKDGQVEPASGGTLVLQDGTPRWIQVGEYSIQPIRSWKSSNTGTVYPSGWKVNVPGQGLDLEVEPMVRDQEIRSDGADAMTYWEGCVTVRGTSRGRPVQGKGYVELTGYRGAMGGHL